MGLVNIPGGLRSAVLQIPEGEPGHCLGSAGEVSAFDESALAGEASTFIFFPFETKLDVTCLTTSLDEAPHTPPFVI